MNFYRFIPRAVTAAAIGAVALTGCDFGDPTEVNNPNLTEENILNTPRPLTSWTLGLERQAAIAFNSYVVEAEILSDNYVNTQTFYNQNFDGLNIQFTDADINGMLFSISDLRESAIFGRTTVADADPEATPSLIAENYFWEGVANLLLGEIFVGAPLEGGGATGSPDQLYDQAIAAFQEAISRTTDAQAQTGYRLALARAYYAKGDKSNAVNAAQQVIGEDSDYVRYIQYDEANGIGSTIESAIYDRSSFDDLQPLPRLDFLDPKFALQGGEDANLAFLKAEEAYLILIEAELSDGDTEGAKDLMGDLVDLVDTRPLELVNDRAEDRSQRAPGSRPNDDDFTVRASANDLFETGLVLDRSEDVLVPSVSGTSVTEDDIDDIDDVDEAVQVLYLMRQEIFIAEGRRMFDLGIRFPLSENELLSNENVTTGPLTTAFVPAPLEPFRAQFDDVTVDTAARTATIAVNLNRVLAENRNNDAIVPLF